MKSTGIVRRIDDLGRVVIPKEIRDSKRWNHGTPLEILVDEKGVSFRKFVSMDDEKDKLIKELLNVAGRTENEEAYKIINKALDFVRKN